MAIDINEILKKAENLPHNFHTAIKVSKMLDDFNVSISKLSEVIGVDQALSAKVLKHCNSAQYGFSRKITTIKDAIAKIGFKTLKSMIFAIVSKSSFNQEIKGYGLAKGELWRNSISCAVYSRYLAEITCYSDPDQAFTAGLLRDIGKLVIHEYVKNEYDKIIYLIETENISFLDAEEKILGFSHSKIGGLVGEKWKFPKVLIDVIKYHHTPLTVDLKEIEDINLLNIIHVADLLTIMLGYGIGRDGMLYNADLSCLANLGIELSEPIVEALISDMANLSTEIDSLVSSIE
jgi:HD-like signal output (HDOD) protein